MRNRLSKFLEDVLRQHECVTLPSLGGFILEHCPATWDKVRHVASAPHVAIRFNEALNHHDGILIEEYAVREGISLRRAKLELEKDIQSLKAELLRTHRYRLEGIGILTLEPSGLMGFSPLPSPFIQQAYYGLSSVLTPQRRGEMSLEEQSGKSLTDLHPQSDYLEIRIPRKAIRYSVAAVVAIALVGLPLVMWRPTKETFNASVAPSPQEVSRVVAQVRDEVQQIQPSAQAPQQKERSLWTSPEVGRYYVIIGTEKNHDVAAGYISRFGDKYPHLQIISNKKVYRISADSYTSREEAYKKMQELSAAGVSSWIYIP